MHRMISLLLPLVWVCASVLVPVQPQRAAQVAGRAVPAADGAAHVAGRLLDNLPLYFVENGGQLDPQVQYYLPGRDKTLYFTPQGVTLALHPPSAAGRWVLRLEFVGSDPLIRPQGEGRTEAVFSYFQGPPERWHTGLPAFARVVYRDLWPGVDLTYYGQAGRLKYEFTVRPGADPAQIRLAYRGATEVSLDAGGRLQVRTPLGGFSDDPPLAYQEGEDGRPVNVEVAYAPQDVGPDSYTYGFRLGAYDPSRPLVIDPAILLYCGYIGGSAYDVGNGIAVDGQGNAYVTGRTVSDQTTFPVAVGPDLTYNSDNPRSSDAFVAKVKADGTGLVYCGYIGGAGGQEGRGIAVDGQGNAYVTGWTTSDEATFPVAVGPDLTFNGGDDAFVARVNAEGTALEYCGYIGGSAHDTGFGIAGDQQGNAYVTGWAESDQATFPVVVGPDLTYNGGPDGFVAKVRADGTGLAYCGYIGGSRLDVCRRIAVDTQGSAYVAGYTESDQTTFPVRGGPDLTFNGSDWDAFVTKVLADGTGLAYCGYIGGSCTDAAYGIAVDGEGNAYVTGGTCSDQTTFPVRVGPDLTYGGGFDAFVAKVEAGGTALAYCGYIGGSDVDVGRGIAVDGEGNAYIVGNTASGEGTFPVKGGPDLTHNLDEDAFVARVRADGTALDYCGYIGGNGRDESGGIAVDAEGNAYVVGETASPADSFAVVAGPGLVHRGGVSDAWVAKVGFHEALLYFPLAMRGQGSGAPIAAGQHPCRGFYRIGSPVLSSRR